jgi:glycosyltransferase involved in cell wall biosynthesis
MRILHVSTRDKAGGAEKVAFDLFREQRRRGFASYLAVGEKTLSDPDILEIPNNAYRNPWANLWRATQTSLDRRRSHALARGIGWLANLGELRRWYEWRQGIEDFNYPGTAQLLNLPPNKPDVVHAHNLHGGFFDLRRLVEISHQVPVIFTLHDEWAFTGHCSYTFDCDRWETGCGNCPNLRTYPAIKRDGTDYNLRRKQEIYSRSDLYVSSPSHWLLDKALRSVMNPAIIESKVIPYGIDLNVFRPGNKQMIRQKLGLPQDAKIAIFVANKTHSNPFKDYATIEEAIRKIAAKEDRHRLIFLCVGEEKAEETIGSATIRYFGYQSDPTKVAEFYQSADLYLHAAKAESFGLVIAEAMACGVPAIATNTGGISEVVENGITGYLVPKGDSDMMADKTLYLLDHNEIWQVMADSASRSARRRFNLNRHVDDYMNWYRDILDKRQFNRKQSQ